MNIFVAKLNYRSSSDDLRELFEQFGEVSLASVIIDRETGKSKGFGFVEMSDDSAASEAINALNETDFDGATIVVKKAEPRESRPSRDDRYGGGGGGGNRYGGGGGRDGGGRNKW